MTNQEQYELICEKAKKYDRLVEVLDKIRVEMDEQIIYNTYFNSDMAKGEIIAFEWVKRKIDKYRTGSNETQTNEIVYDVGGHMYGVMGGDVIMDILAGKGKE